MNVFMIFSDYLQLWPHIRLCWAPFKLLHFPKTFSFLVLLALCDLLFLFFFTIIPSHTGLVCFSFAGLYLLLSTFCWLLGCFVFSKPQLKDEHQYWVTTLWISAKRQLQYWGGGDVCATARWSPGSHSVRHASYALQPFYYWYLFL